MEYSIKLVVLGEFFVLTGVFRMVRGLAGHTTVRTLQKSPKAMNVLVAAFLVAAVVSWWLLTHLFES